MFASNALCIITLSPNRKVSVSAASIYLLKVSNKNTRKRCKRYSKLTIKTAERRH